MLNGRLLNMFGLCLLMIISSITADHIATSSLPNLSIIKSGNSYYCTITNDTLGSALLWDYQNTDSRPSSNVHCTLDKNNECTLKNLRNTNWQWIDDKNVSPILDYRWESFKALTLTDDPQEVYETKDGNFRISFSVKIKEVHILLCDDLNYDYYLVGVYSNCYWIGLGANGGKKSYIRKCVAGAIPITLEKYPEDGKCAEKQTEFIGIVTSETEWNHFTILKQGNTITVWNYGQSKPILIYTDGSWNPFTIEYVFAKPFLSKPGYMKIHEVRTLTTNKSSVGITIQLKDRFSIQTNCLALHVKTCKDCSFKITLGNEVLKQQTAKSLGDDWQEIFLQDENNFTEINEISLQTLSEAEDNAEELYWHISDTIRRCGNADIAMKQGDGEGCCYTLKYPNQKICTASIEDISNQGDWTCPTNTIGKNCIPCTSIPDRLKCSYSKICDLTSNGSICSCAPGYYDKDCQSICPPRLYGFNCRMDCGRCKYACNNVDGTCSPCEENFEGHTCQRAILPLLKNAPKVSKIRYTNVTILAYMEYEGKEKPYFYQILYREVGEIWMKYGELMLYRKSPQSVIVNNLKTSTKYEIKVILITSSGSNYDGRFVPEVEFETTCADIPEDILQNRIGNTSIVLKIDVNKPQYKETCLLSQYRLFVYDSMKIYSMYNRLLQRENIIDGLKPYNNYRIEIRKNNAIILNKMLQTAQSAPGSVQNVVYNTTSTTLRIKWDNPLSKNGYITGYRIQCRHVRYRMCDINSYGSGSDTVISATNTTATVSNLYPFSNYICKIWAVTEYDGEPSEFFIQTTAARSPNAEEIPDLTFTDSKEQLSVMMTWRCEKLRGPLRFKAVLTCRSEWCFNQTQNYIGRSIRENSGKSESKMEFQRIGKTEYILQLFISRGDEDFFFVKRYTTEPSVPGYVRDVAIYSKNSSSISIRWLPPYPPEGDVESYWVWHHELSIEMEIKKTAFCKLWPEHICVTITGLEEHTTYYFQIRAKNVDVSEKGRTTEVSTDTQEKIPQPPQNMTLQWDEQYNLTIGWQHPDRTNGVLREFLLYINDENPASYPVTDENPQYQYKTGVSENVSLRKLTIKIAARNSAGVSPVISDSVFSPPKTPKFVENPNIDDVRSTSFNINVPEISSVEGETSKMYIIVTNIQKHDVENQHPIERKLLKKIGLELDTSWTVGEFDLTNSKTRRGFNFKVGNELETVSNVDSSWILNNRKLETGTAYKVSIILNNTFRNFVRYNLYTLNCTTLLQSESTSTNYLLVLLLLIPVLLLCIGGVLYMKRKNINMLPKGFITLQQPELSRNSIDVPLRSLTSTNELLSENNLHSKNVFRKYTKPIELADLHLYIKTGIKGGALEKQYQLIFQDVNRASNQTTKTNYDSNTVKFQNTNKKSCGDCIDANYIDGYNAEKAYIETVVPNINSMNKFWQMIWQENVEYIILMTNQAEKKEIEKYWPDLKTTRDFDNIKLQLNNIKVMPNYEVSNFSISFNDESRKVQQFHYLTWPDYGMPSEAYKLAPFLKKVLSIPRGGSPIVVYSKGYVDYSSALILCDIGLRMAANENKIDLLYYMYKILQQRAHTVGNIEQYKLVHLALLEYIEIENTSIVYDGLMEQNIEIRMNDMIEEEMKYLDGFGWQHELKFISNSDLKSTFPDNSESDGYLVSLDVSADQSSKSVNPIAVDSFLTPAKFIVTQYPRNDTLKDFWRLVDEKHISVIICLNQLEFPDKAGCKFFPTSSEYPLVLAPHLEIKYMGNDVKTHYVVYILTMTRQDGYQGSDSTIKIMYVQNWPVNMLHPQNTIDLLKTYKEMNRLGRTTDTVLVTCSNGITSSGLFVAMCFVLDKLNADQTCDVCLAVRTVRHSRKEFVRTKEQFSFLYRCALEYIHHFGLYSIANDW